MDRVKGKVAIVTGGSLGIGRSACHLLAHEGALLAVTDVLDREGRNTVHEIQEAGGRAEFWHLDVGKEAEVKAVFRAVNEHFGRIDALVNNAGISGANRPTHELTEEEWDAVMAVNVKGVFFCTKHVIPYMKKREYYQPVFDLWTRRGRGRTALSRIERRSSPDDEERCAHLRSRQDQSQLDSPWFHLDAHGGEVCGGTGRSCRSAKPA